MRGPPDAEAGPRQDLTSALDYLASRGKRCLDVAGYSFGAWVAFMTVQGESRANRAVLVAPPVDVLEFSGASEGIRLVVGAGDDHFAATRSLERHVARWGRGARLVVIPSANHYFMLKSDELTSVVKGFLSHEG